MPLFSREVAPQCFEQGYKKDCITCKPGYSFNYAELIAAAKDGCPDCQVLVEGIVARTNKTREYRLSATDNGPLLVSLDTGDTLSFYTLPGRYKVLPALRSVSY